MNNYWIDFWKEYAINATGMDEQSQVLRTLHRKPISEELWLHTLEEIDKVFDVHDGERILDLCSGNGLLAKHLVEKGVKVVAVDISEELLKNIANIDNIETLTSDIRLLDFNENSFDKVIFYAGIQYLNNNEALILLKNIFKWLKPDGTAYIGDIPDLNKRWDFFNTKERQRVFFDNLLTNKAIVGNWYEQEWFLNLKDYIGFSSGKFLKQDNRLINASHRFDYIYKK